MGDQQIIADSIQVLSLPMRYRFRSVSERELILFQGSRRWAEWSPFIEYPDAVAARWLRAALECANSDLPPALRTRIPINATLPAAGTAELRELLASFSGSKTVKLKVGGESSWHEDLARIELISRELPEARLRLDANGSWSVAEAIRAVSKVLEIGVALDYLEQPVAGISELVELRTELAALGLPVPIAIDESLRNAPGDAALLGELRPEVVILKAAPIGGIASALELQSAFPGSRFVVSSALESSIGLQAGLHLAAALDTAPEDCGLGTCLFFENDVVSSPLRPNGGWIDLPAEPLEPEPALTAGLKAPVARRDWWLARLERCLALL